MSTEDGVAGLSALSQEAERRRADAVKRSLETLPSVIKEIVRTEVSYVVAPELLPTQHVDFPRLITELKSEYKLSPAFPRFDSQAVQSLGVDMSKVNEATMARMMTTFDTGLKFQEGRYNTGANSFVPINSLALTGERIIANVGGVTAIAEALIGETFERLWHASGTDKRWNPQLAKLKTYGTHSRVAIKGLSRGLVSGRLAEMLEDNLASGIGIGPEMLSRSAHDDFKPAADVMVVWGLDKLEIGVTIFNKSNGRAEKESLRFLVPSREEFGRDVLDVLSTMPTDTHVKVIVELAKRMGA